MMFRLLISFVDYQNKNRYRSLLLLFVGIAITASLIKGQNFCWDCLHYHYYNGWAFWNDRLAIDVTPADGLHTYFSPLVDGIEYLIFIHLPPLLYLAVLGAISGVGIFYCFLVNEIILQRYDVKVILLATLISCTGVAHIMQLGSMMNENIIAVFLIMGFYYIIRYYQTNRKIYLSIVGFTLGIALGIKLTAITYILAMGIVFFLQNFNIKREFKSYLIIVLALIFSVLIINGFWMLKMYHLFHNPIYPNFNHFFNPNSSLTFSRDIQYIPKDFTSHLILPFKLMAKQSNITDFSALRDWHFPLAIIASLFLLLRYFIFRKSLLLSKIAVNDKALNDKQIIFTVLSFLIGYMIWEHLFAIQRYTIFLEYLSGSIVIYATLLVTAKQHKLQKYLLIFLSVAMIATLKSANIGYAPLSANIKSLSSDIKVENSLVVLDNGTSYLAPMLGASNIYINDPFAQLTDSEQAMKKQSILQKYLTNSLPIFTVYDLANQEQIKSSSWLLNNKLHLVDCKYINAFKMSKRVICKVY